jgi:hypothetical protein
MIPFGLTTEQFVTRQRRWLEKASNALIAELRDVIADSVPSTVTSAEVQIFLGQDGTDGPSVWLYYNGPNRRIDHTDPSIFAGRSRKLALGLAEMPYFDQRYFDSDLFPGIDLRANAIKSWFAECWWKAGGWTFPCPTHLVVHDDFGDGDGIILTERDAAAAPN